MSVGILQGRLSPSPDGRFQFFPSEWEREFMLAKLIGFSSIEWLFDWVDYDENSIANPILARDGRAKIATCARTSGVAVNSVCADYFMKYRLDGTPQETAPHIAILLALIEAAASTKMRLLLVPLLEKNAIKNEDQKNAVAANMRSAVKFAEKCGVRIGFESELPADELADFLDRFNSDAVGVYYDVGNCTSYGFDCPRDLRQLDRLVFGVHVKDRKNGSSQSVMLGSGDTDFKGCVRALMDIGFQGTLIMQTWHGDDYLSDARAQYKFLRQIIDKKPITT